VSGVSSEENTMTQPIAPCLWFDGNAEEAANYYVSVFPNAKITDVQKYPEAALEVSGKPAGSVMTVEFDLNGMRFMGLNGGPQEGFNFSPATSFVVMCEDQKEIDHFWSKLSAVPEAEQCGWCTDKFGITWQVTPTILNELLSDPAKTEKVTEAFLQMKKFDIAKLQEAANS
jgi:predicted 3-demethylubiquinone-9 3-methyltransferase (glyoxalase superfamily)